MLNKRFTASLVLLTLFPLSLYAQVGDIFGFTGLIFSWVEKIGFLFWVLSIALFFWGIVKFIGNAGDTAAHEQGKKFIMWGLLSFLVLVSLWGIVSLILVDTLGINPSGTQFLDKNDTVIAP